jgi:pimeloyl-ACP methyl ester carboxylesterase
MEGAPKNTGSRRESSKLLQIYKLESGVTVEILEPREFTPRLKEGGIEGNPIRAIVFLPGWMMGAHSKSVEGLCQSYADSSGVRTLAITTRAVERGSKNVDADVDFSYEEARAIITWIKEHQIKEITLVGHSQGGGKAIDIASLLANDPNLKVDGLVLIASVGLYEQSPIVLTTNFSKDSMINTPITMGKGLFKKDIKTMERGAQAGLDVVSNITTDIGKSGLLKYPKRFGNEISEMSEFNHHSREVIVPVVVINGEMDPVSDYKQVVPDRGGLDEVIEDEEKIARIRIEREIYLKENNFPNAPWVRMLVPKKLGHHSLPFFRPEQIAKTSLYLLERGENLKN